MKYIRTKDGRIVDISLMQECEADDDKGNRVFDGYEDKYGYYYPVENILKQANTIEELCDEFVAITTDGNHILYDDETSYWKTRQEYSKLKFEVAKHFKDKDTIYGAIWTDKGLIYVAKMNDKGELELL